MQLVCPACGTKNRVPDDRIADAPACGRCGAAVAAPAPFALADDAFDRYLAGTDAPVLVDFWADWCGPCKAMAPQFAAAAAQRPGVRFAKVDTEAAPRAAMRHRIRSIPTVVLFKGGQEVARRSGALSAADLLRWLDADV